MKISLEWLSDFIDLRERDPQRLADALTEATGEVEELVRLGTLLDHCCVGRVLSLEKHPNADKLSVCRVQTDRGEKNVVCGGTNVRAGMRVCFAHAGATIRWHGKEMMKLEKAKIRGVESEGMICTAEELDLLEQFPRSRDRTVIDLGDGEEGVGQDLRGYLGFTDVVFHIDNHAITHRADLFSHIGIARELVALGLAEWKSGNIKNGSIETPHAASLRPGNNVMFAKKPIPFAFKNDIPSLVPRYASCILAIDSLGETPQWMRRRLEATGWRCVSLPVDITNYVAMETGMPLHAFDADDLRGDVHIRLSKKHERITTLDGVERKLPDGAIVLSDDDGIFDLMGIMGGLRSSTKFSTKHIYLHSAAVDPVCIRRAILATGHRTDAATVYEKGIPRVVVEQGFLSALALMLELLPGANVVSAKESWGDDGDPPAISLPLARASSMLGVEIPEAEAVRILTSLECTVGTGGSTKKTRRKRVQSSEFRQQKMPPSEVRSPNSEVFTVRPPLHRLGDLRGTHDLIEEIGRIYGYNRIPALPPHASAKPPARDFRTGVIRHALKEEGFLELLPLSLVSPDLLTKAGRDPSSAVRIENPLGEELSLLHTSVFPSLCEQIERYPLGSGERRGIFSIGTVFARGKDERREFGFLLAQSDATGWDPKRTPFFQLKQSIDSSLAQAGYAVETARAETVSAFAHPGRTAQVMARTAGDLNRESGGELRPLQSIGLLFEVHPEIARRFELPARTAASLLDLPLLLTIEPGVRTAAALPQFPSISYDVTFPMDQREEAARMLETFRDASDLLERVEIVDLFASSKDAPGNYALTIRFTYRAKDRTLTEEEVRKAHQGILDSVSGRER
ncbi:phenylalanine--tRNA ligase subunit beta [Candidatus Peregrinibacteria bacterium]|nr:phenylalanine--tRNA ligase subunit beta [Candidatus Peregrinibacteria bacterium]